MADFSVDRSDSPVLGSHWTQGPPADTVTELLRTLELTVSRRLDGVLHGNYQGLTPGHGSEPGESRPYALGDDVRRIDWNVTARTQETYIRKQIADRDLTAWLVVDASATMQFGTVTNTKAQTALAATAAVGFLTARNQNRVGAVMVAGSDIRSVPPRSGKNQIRAVLSMLAAPPVSDGHGRADLSGALDRVGALAKRRGFIAIISDFAGSDWTGALGRLSLRHDLLAITVHDPREYDVPPIGLVQMVDPASGRTREVRVTESVQRKFITAAAKQRTARLDGLRRAGADTIELTTDGDWLGNVVAHVQRRRTQAVRSGVLTR